MGRLKAVLIGAVFAVCTGFPSVAGEVAVLQNGQGRHADEFDTAFTALGIQPLRFTDTSESLAAFFKALGGVEIVIVSPLFNWNAGLAGKVDMSPLREYLEAGGMIVVTDASYSPLRQLLDPVLPGVGTIRDGKCTSSQWAVNGHAANVEPVHPLRSFPNAVIDPDSWPHFDSVPTGWTTIAVCSEGKPVIFCREIGKGFAVLSALRQPNPKAIENYCAFARLRRSGLAVKAFSVTPLRPGAGSLSLTLSSPPPPGVSLELEIVGPQGKTTRFTANLTSTAGTLPFSEPYRGPITASLYVVTPAGRALAYRRMAEMPPLMRVCPNAYRGILSTERRTDTVRFPVRFAPDRENLAGAKLSLAVFDASSNCVASLAEVLPTDGVPRERWVPFPLDRSLPPGGYRIDALLEKPASHDAPRIREVSSAFFEIRAPHEAQTIIDDDGTFLVNGHPFFPLGIYHTNPDAYAELEAVGFNTQQFWKWDLGLDGSGVPVNLNRAAGHKLKCLFESNHRGRAIYEDCAKRLASHPAILMWYVLDEPAEGSEASMTEANDTWHAFDRDHPTFLASCRPDLFEHHANYADVLGFDPYGNMEKVLDWCRRLEQGVGRHKATVCIPWADQTDLRLVRAMAYAAIAHNVRGVIWYCWHQAGGGPLGVGIHSKPETKACYKTLLAELRAIMPGLTSTERRPFEEGAIHGIVLGAPNAVGGRYVVLVNTSDRKVAADFAVPELARQNAVSLPCGKKVAKRDKEGGAALDKKGDPVMEEDTLAIEDGHIRHVFEPYETLVLRW
ncbi:MAG: hypothetical protein J6U40_07895 [Kiritimatiellae bacterium]|nr:hypothetical protein [Kiritimatiellia bacterium]